MRYFWYSACFIGAILLCGCADETPAVRQDRRALRSPVYDAEFRSTWNDDSAEVADYTIQRLRQGKLEQGTATAITRRLMYTEDERVPVDPAHAQTRDLFPAIELNWIERTTDPPQASEEMTTSALTLTAVDGRVPGVETKTDFSLQGWSGQLFHQLLFDATGVRSHQYSYFANEGDEQITLAYPADGVSGDALWFWARHMAAPQLNSGEQRSVSLLPALRDVRKEHRQLNWRHAVLSRGAATQTVAGHSAEVFTAATDDGRSETFFVETVRPFRILRWTGSTGEHADLVSSSRMKLPAPPAPAAGTGNETAQN